MGYNIFKRPLNYLQQSRVRGMQVSTAASTALQPNQILGLKTTSANAVVYTIAPNVKAGDILELGNLTPSSSLGQFHINAQSSGAFGYAPATTPQDMLTLSTQGIGVRLIALNSSEWMVVGAGSPLLSTST